MNLTHIQLRPMFRTMLQEVITAANSLTNPRASSRALLCFMARASNSWRSICILNQSGSDEDSLDAIPIDAATIFRATYDAYLQALFITSVSGGDREERAQLYLDFVIIEKWRNSSALVKQNNLQAQIISMSPLRETGEPQLEARYNCLKPKYVNTSGKGVRSQWYPQGNLANLAQEVNAREEYDWFFKTYNTCVHTGPLVMLHGPPAKGEDIEKLSQIIVARVAHMVSENDSLTLGSVSRTLIDEHRKDVLDCI